jgi:hypothetical protein
MRDLCELENVDWNSFPATQWWSPGEVPEALRALSSVSDPASAKRAYDRCLFAIGNNHAGSLYRVAPTVAPFLTWLLAFGSDATCASAFEVLSDAVTFGADDPEERVPTPDGRNVEVDVAFRAAVRSSLAEFLVGATDNAHRCTTVRARELIEVIDSY